VGVRGTLTFTTGLGTAEPIVVILPRVAKPAKLHSPTGPLREALRTGPANQVHHLLGSSATVKPGVSRYFRSLIGPKVLIERPGHVGSR
jgi:hypothetical protein